MVGLFRGLKNGVYQWYSRVAERGDMAESDIAEAIMSSVIDPTSVWLTGTVAWFDEQRGFGFIDPDGVRQWPVFVEYSRIDVPGYRALTEGQLVRYLCDPAAHGRAAAVVRPYPLRISPL